MNIIRCPDDRTLTLSENRARNVIFQSLRLSFYRLFFLFLSLPLFVAIYYRSKIKRNDVKSEFIERFYVFISPCYLPCVYFRYSP